MHWDIVTLMLHISHVTIAAILTLYSLAYENADNPHPMYPSLLMNNALGNSTRSDLLISATMLWAYFYCRPFFGCQAIVVSVQSVPAEITWNIFRDVVLWFVKGSASCFRNLLRCQTPE